MHNQRGFAVTGVSVLIALASLTALVVGSYWLGASRKEAEMRVELAKKDEQLQALQGAVLQEYRAQDRKNVGAYLLGQQHAKDRYGRIKQTASQHVVDHPVLRDLGCALPDDVMRNLNAARASVGTGPDGPEVARGVPSPGPGK